LLASQFFGIQLLKFECEQARLKLKDEMVEAAANCTLALAIDPSNIKAMFRRGQV
jgi:lipopolysaccharide biosynthesis regulator YciM